MSDLVERKRLRQSTASSVRLHSLQLRASGSLSLPTRTTPTDDYFYTSRTISAGPLRALHFVLCNASSDPTKKVIS
jgi:hypothetical protein